MIAFLLSYSDIFESNENIPMTRNALEEFLLTAASAYFGGTES